MAIKSRLQLVCQLLREKSDNAYSEVVRQSLYRAECLGEAAKLEKGIFGKPELDAHRQVAELLGEHRAYAKAVQMVLEVIATEEA